MIKKYCCMLQWFLVGIVVLGILSSRKAFGAEKYIPAPTNEAELEERLESLHKRYAPYLRSLPEPLAVRSREYLDSNKWFSQYELETADYSDIRVPDPKPWFDKEYDDGDWKKTTVPEWQYKGDTKSSRTAVSCILWYRTDFKLELPKSGERVFLNFDGVDWEAEVWLNGTLLGDHIAYYQAFRFDVTDVLEEKNTLAVRVKSGPIWGMPRANSAVFSLPPAKEQRVVKDKAKSYIEYKKGSLWLGGGCGILRSVYLERCGVVSVQDILVRSNPRTGKSVVRTFLDTTETKTLSLQIEIIPENFKGQSYTASIPINVGKGISEKSAVIRMPDAKIWSPDSPYLYRCRVLVKDSDKVLDGKDVLFGHRSIDMVSELKPMKGEKAGRFLLNDKPIYLRGTNIEGLNLLYHWGEVENVLDLLFKVKAANFNAVRSVQHVQFPEVREMQDRLGIMSQQDQGSRQPYKTHGEMNGMSEENCKIVKERLLDHLTRTGPILARECYNNPGVVLLSYANEAGKDRGPKQEIDYTDIVKGALSIDPERIIKPICGHQARGVVPSFYKGRTGYDFTDELWANVIEDLHTYQGWYVWHTRPDQWAIVYPEDDRLITVGEYGGEALDSYQTMLDSYPKHWGAVPSKETNTLFGHVQTGRLGNQFMGLRGKKPGSLIEHIEASQTYQADLLTEITKGLRISRRICGYFQYHYVDVLAATWPKSIVSHDRKPKKGYYAMAQINQPLVPLPRIRRMEQGMTMELWIANDTNTKHDNVRLTWSISHNGKIILQGEETTNIKNRRPKEIGQVDLSTVPLEAEVVTIDMKLIDSRGDKLSSFNQEVYLLSFRPEFHKDKGN